MGRLMSLSGRSLCASAGSRRAPTRAKGWSPTVTAYQRSPHFGSLEQPYRLRISNIPADVHYLFRQLFPRANPPSGYCWLRLGKGPVGGRALPWWEFAHILCWNTRHLQPGRGGRGPESPAISNAVQAQRRQALRPDHPRVGTSGAVLSPRRGLRDPGLAPSSPPSAATDDRGRGSSSVGGHGPRGEWKNPGHHAAIRADGSSRPSSTAARTVAMQCAPCGDQRMRWRLAMRAFAISSTDASAREVEIGRPAR